LIAMTFHVISPIGLFINVLLIPVTAFVLCAGFVTLAVGLLLPPLATLPGVCFSGMLQTLSELITLTAGVQTGHIYIPDLPLWFAPIFYGMMILLLSFQHSQVQKAAVSGLYVTIILGFAVAHLQRQPDGLRCTILDIGHGNATVVELSDGRVILVDAGALNRGQRAADIVCGYLWTHGYDSLSEIVISHADAD
ncbi:MAG: hypothetical protein GY758_20475, partial [Fuerstiella sp.]|nr:hypothetical protein [Fuerstiella sp.]